MNAAITGWGKCMPPAVLTNADLATFLETDDEWITTRTGMKERRVSHVSAVEMSVVAAERALACAGLTAKDVDLIVYGSCTPEEQVPNAASARRIAPELSTRRSHADSHAVGRRTPPGFQATATVSPSRMPSARVARTSTRWPPSAGGDHSPAASNVASGDLSAPSTLIATDLSIAP